MDERRRISDAVDKFKQRASAKALVPLFSSKRLKTSSTVIMASHKHEPCSHVNMKNVYTLCEHLPMNEMGDRLREARARHHKSARQAAIKYHWTPSTYAAHENGQNDFGPDEARKYGKAFKTNPGWLLTGDDGPGWEYRETGINDPDYEERPSGGVLEIDVYAGMGGGGSLEGREVRSDGDYADAIKPEAWHFPSRFMREEVRAPENRVVVIETKGDSMSPTILSGDRVIVDTGHRIPSPDGIYAVRDAFGEIVVKRLQVMRGNDPPIIRIISDNKAHDAQDVGADDIAIVGRVLWSLKRL